MSTPLRGKRLVLLGLGALLLVVLPSLLMWLYFGLWHRPTAHRHMPAGTNIAVRADAQELLLFGPVRQHLWPLFVGDDGAADDVSTRRKRLEEATGAKIPQDFREVVVASVHAESWVVIFGGKMPRDRFVAGLARFFEQEGATGWSLEEPILRHERGAAVAQAEDGSVIFGTDVAITRAALATNDELPLPLATEGVVSFAVTAQAYDEGLRLLPSVPGLDALGKLAQLTGQADLGDAPRVHIRMTPEPGEDAAALASQVETALGALALGLTLMPTDLDGAKEALSGAEVTAKDGAVEVNAPWPYEALDRMAARLAERIRAARSQRAASP